MTSTDATTRVPGVSDPDAPDMTHTQMADAILWRGGLREKKEAGRTAFTAPIARAFPTEEDAAWDDEIAALLADISDPNRRVPLRPASEMYQTWLSEGFVGARPAQAGEDGAPETVRQMRDIAFTRGAEAMAD